MSDAPKQPRNAEVVSKDGQFNQAHARWWDATARRAYSAIQSFNEFFSLDTLTDPVDTANDYLLVYDASSSAAKKVPVVNVSSTPQYTVEYELLASYDASDWVKEFGTSGAWQIGIAIPDGYGSIIVNYRNDYAGQSSITDSFISISTNSGSTFVTAQYIGTRGTTNIQGSAQQIPHHNDWDNGESWRGQIEFVNYSSAAVLKRACHFYYEGGGKRAALDMLWNSATPVNYLLLSFGRAFTGSTLSNGDVEVWGSKAVLI